MSIQERTALRRRAASRSSAGTAAAGDRTARLDGISWKQALGKLASPAFRLHHYRSIHNRLLQRAFCELDSSRERDCNA